MLLYGRDAEVAEWVAAQSGNEAPAVDAAIGSVRDGELVAGVYFDCMTKANVFAHIACTSGVPVELLRAAMHYVFRTADLPRVTLAVSAGNVKALALVEAMGAEKEAQLRKACGDHDLMLYVLWRGSALPQRLLSRGI